MQLHNCLGSAMLSRNIMVLYGTNMGIIRGFVPFGYAAARKVMVRRSIALNCLLCDTVQDAT